MNGWKEGGMNGPIRTGGRKTPKLASLCVVFLGCRLLLFLFLVCSVIHCFVFAFSQSSTDQSKSETVGHIYMFVAL